MSTYLVTYKVGDIVDIKANSAEQKGMPHKVRLLLYYSSSLHAQQEHLLILHPIISSPPSSLPYSSHGSSSNPTNLDLTFSLPSFLLPFPSPLLLLQLGHHYYHHQFYHGKTGVVYNVSPRGVGVICFKVVGNRYLEKRVNLRIEHVKHSKCRQEFVARVKRNAALKREAKEKGG